MCLSRSCNKKVFRDGGIINKRLKTVRCFPTKQLAVLQLANSHFLGRPMFSPILAHLCHASFQLFFFLWIFISLRSFRRSPTALEAEKAAATAHPARPASERAATAATAHPARPVSERAVLLGTGSVATPQPAIAATCDGDSSSRVLLRPAGKRSAIRERRRPGCADVTGNLVVSMSSVFACSNFGWVVCWPRGRAGFDLRVWRRASVVSCFCSCISCCWCFSYGVVLRMRGVVLELLDVLGIFVLNLFICAEDRCRCFGRLGYWRSLSSCVCLFGAMLVWPEFVHLCST
jgi:hypothetical protein